MTTKIVIVALVLILNTSAALSIYHHKPTPDCVLVKKYLTYYGQYYRIPLEALYRLAKMESPWRADSTDSSYVASKQIGKSGELGPMQIKPRTARLVWHDPTITKWHLLHDVRFNIRTGCKLLDQEFLYWRDHYSDIDQIWLMTFTSYNLGRTTTLKLHGKPNKYGKAVYFK